jgi:hypothetical protein
MSYKYDGKYLKRNGSTIANVRDNKICKGTTSSVVANIKDDDVREGTSSRELINVRGNDIRLASGSSRIGTMRDVDKAIDGPGGITKAALWFLFVR